MREALLVIDVQNDYFPGGTNELVHPYETEKRIQELIADSRINGRPIIYIQHFNTCHWFTRLITCVAISCISTVADIVT